MYKNYKKFSQHRKYYKTTVSNTMRSPNGNIFKLDQSQNKGRCSFTCPPDITYQFECLINTQQYMQQYSSKMPSINEEISCYLG